MRDRILRKIFPVDSILLDENVLQRTFACAENIDEFALDSGVPNQIEPSGGQCVHEPRIIWICHIENEHAGGASRNI